ncbi:MAG: D-xylose transport system permease protein [Actinomycetota bacterium]
MSGTETTLRGPSGAPPTWSPASLAHLWWQKVRTGEIGSAPIILAIVLIGVFFQTKNSNFLSATNFNNLLVQMAGVTVIAFGVAFVLLIGEIDLSVGFISGIAGVAVAEFQLPGSSHDYPGLVAILFAVLVGAVIGVFQGSFVAFLGVPSFVVTLAGNLAWQGVILRSLPQGVIVIQDSTINDIANYFFSPTVGWIVAAAIAGSYALITLNDIRVQRRSRLPVDDLPGRLARIAVVAALSAGVAYWAGTDPRRGLPFAALLIVALLALLSVLAARTTFGRHVYAVGGNAEAAHRAGINVTRIRLLVFTISGAMSALGGVIFASQLRSVDLSAGGGTILLDSIAAAVIGGVSLFGGRGRVGGVVFGALVIAIIANGTDLVGYSASAQYIITAAILLAAVTLDTLARRRLADSGL